MIAWTDRLLAAARGYLKLYVLFLRAVIQTLLHRRRYGPRRPAWSREFELMVQVLALGLPAVDSFEASVIRNPFDRLTAVPLPQRNTVLPLRDAPVSGEWITPPRLEDGPVVLYLHGGGYVSGSPRTHRLITTQIARIAGARVLAVDYRLAPEHPYPAALADAWAAYWWLLTQGVFSSDIIIAGDSAGGGLAIALALALRDANMPLPAGVIGLSPWLDLALEGESVQCGESVDYLNPRVLKGCAQLYLNGSDLHTPLASPLYADLQGLPPLLVQASTSELLVDDSRRFAERARAAGVAIELQLWDDLVHVFQFFYLIAPDARAALEQIGRFIRRQTGREEADREPVADHSGGHNHTGG
jgi:acetyl esterase/lipase